MVVIVSLVFLQYKVGDQKQIILCMAILWNTF